MGRYLKPLGLGAIGTILISCELLQIPPLVISRHRPAIEQRLQLGGGGPVITRVVDLRRVELRGVYLQQLCVRRGRCDFVHLLGVKRLPAFVSFQALTDQPIEGVCKGLPVVDLLARQASISSPISILVDIWGDKKRRESRSRTKRVMSAPTMMMTE